jgi:hypothetical protein
MAAARSWQKTTPCRRRFASAVELQIPMGNGTDRGDAQVRDPQGVT